MAVDRVRRRHRLRLSSLSRAARHLLRHGVGEPRRDPAAPLSPRRALDPRRLCGARLVRPDRAAASRRAPHLVAVRLGVLVHHLRAVAQHRRLGVLGRARALPRLHLEGPGRAAGGGARRAVLLHLRPRHDPARRPRADDQAGSSSVGWRAPACTTGSPTRRRRASSASRSSASSPSMSSARSCI